MACEHERWADASAILERQGENAHEYISDRIGALANEGDAAGIERLLDIAARIDRLNRRGATH